ncbi:MAG: hypothetical protein JXR32_08800, partial [Anaerolineaceae bacterium]|nr:hypothetical protein [Anaerolineaceae bacterium]
MTNWLKKLLKDLPTLILSFLLSVAVWISAVTAADPNDTRQYPQPVPVEVLGLNPDLSLSGEIPDTVSVTMNAPSSTWTKILSTPNVIKAYIDLSDKVEGDYEIKINIQIEARPLEVILIDPALASVHLEYSANVDMAI